VQILLYHNLNRVLRTANEAKPKRYEHHSTVYVSDSGQVAFAYHKGTGDVEKIVWSGPHQIIASPREWHLVKFVARIPTTPTGRLDLGDSPPFQNMPTRRS
jgi:hypothetical protein